jgi:hypothetical protein
MHKPCPVQKIYNRREKAGLNIFRGIPYKTTSIEIGLNKAPFFKYIRPTIPILEADINNIVKYVPSPIYLKNISNSKILLKEELNKEFPKEDLKEKINSGKIII